MRYITRIFGTNSDPLTRLVGGVAIGLLLFGSINVVRDGVPTVPLLLYRGAIILAGMCFLFWVTSLIQKRK